MNNMSKQDPWKYAQNGKGENPFLEIETPATSKNPIGEFIIKDVKYSGQTIDVAIASELLKNEQHMTVLSWQNYNLAQAVKCRANPTYQPQFVMPLPLLYAVCVRAKEIKNHQFIELFTKGLEKNGIITSTTINYSDVDDIYHRNYQLDFKNDPISINLKSELSKVNNPSAPLHCLIGESNPTAVKRNMPCSSMRDFLVEKPTYEEAINTKPKLGVAICLKRRGYVIRANVDTTYDNFVAIGMRMIR